MFYKGMEIPACLDKFSENTLMDISNAFSQSKKQQPFN